MKKILVLLCIMMFIIPKSVVAEESIDQSSEAFSVAEEIEMNDETSQEIEELSEEAVESSALEEQKTVLESGEEELVVDETENEKLVQPQQLFTIPVDNAIVVDGPIYDNTTTITGYVDASLSLLQIDLLGIIGLELSLDDLLGMLLDYDITLYADGSRVMSVDIIDDGKFTFELAEPFPANTILTFRVPVIPLSLLRLIDISDTVTTVQAHRLEFSEVPANIAFETVPTIYEPNRRIYRQSPNDLSFSILNNTNSDWNLSAFINQPLLSSDGSHALNDVLYFQTHSGNLLPINSESQIVGTSSESYQGADPEIDVISWGPEAGPTLQMNPYDAYPDTTYSTTIHWVLSNAAQ